MLHIRSNVPMRLTSSLARLLTWCACFIMDRCTCYHMPVGLYNIVMEHGVGTQCFHSNLCCGFDLVSFPLGCTLVQGLQLGTRLWFVDWIMDEIAPLSLRVGRSQKERQRGTEKWESSLESKQMWLTSSFSFGHHKRKRKTGENKKQRNAFAFQQKNLPLLAKTNWLAESVCSLPCSLCWPNQLIACCWLTTWHKTIFYSSLAWWCTLS